MNNDTEIINKPVYLFGWSAFTNKNIKLYLLLLLKKFVYKYVLE